MPDYSLNSTVRSSAIQGEQSVNDAACPSKGGPAEAGGHTTSSRPLLDSARSPEDLSEAMNDREKWRERVRDIRVSGTT